MLHQVDDVAHILVKAHVQHLVGFIQHHGLHVGHIDGLVAVVVHQAARGGHHHLTARFQLALLLVHARAAINADDLDAGQKLGQVLQVLGNLLGQFPGRAQHHGLGFLPGRVHLGQDGNAEGHGLAGAGGGLGNHVMAGHHQGDGLFLNLGHLGKTHGLGGAYDLGRHVGKLGKLHRILPFVDFYIFLLL